MKKSTVLNFPGFRPQAVAEDSFFIDPRLVEEGELLQVKKGKTDFPDGTKVTFIDQSRTGEMYVTFNESVTSHDGITYSAHQPFLFDPMHLQRLEH